MKAALIAGIALLGAESAQADVITEPFSFSNINNLAAGSSITESSTAIAKFNPALGMLNSVSLSATLEATFTGVSATLTGSLTGSISLAPFDETFSGSCRDTSGTCTIGPVGFTLISTTSLANFIGVGTLSASTTINNTSSVPTLDFTFSNERISYNYTPAAVVPEPGSLSVVAAGLFGLGWAYRRRMRGT